MRRDSGLSEVRLDGRRGHFHPFQRPCGGGALRALAEANALDPRELETFYKDGTRFPALPPVNTLAEIPFATGSLGHGLSLCAGMAVGAILNRRERRFFCLTSDGELDEGSTWEAALFIAHRKLTNVVWLIDRNRIQAIGGTEEVLALEPLDAKLDAFGFHVIAADGHDFTSLLELRDQCTQALADANPDVRWPSSATPSRVTAFVTCKTRWLPTTCRWTTRSTPGARRAGDGARGCGGGGPRCGMSSRGRWSRSSESASDLVFITGDVGYLAVEEIAETYGERFINAGIAEQNMVSLAAGLARQGHFPGSTASPPSSRFVPTNRSARTSVCTSSRSSWSATAAATATASWGPPITPSRMSAPCGSCPTCGSTFR